MSRLSVALMCIVVACLLSSCMNNDKLQPYSYSSSDPNALFYTNPIVSERADPWIYEHTDGYYYMMASVPEYDRLELRRAATMTGLAYAEPVTVWEKNEDGIISKNLWAPEIYHIDGKWYIYFSAARADREFDHRMYVLENASANPLQGEWELKGQILTGHEVFQIDASLFQHRDTWYMMWSGAGAKGNTLYMAQLANPWTLASSRIMLTEPEYDWEKRAVVHVTEAPEVIAYGDRIYLTYSASFCDANYNMGLLSAHADSDLMDPASWEKSPQPIFASNEVSNAYGPGHGSFLNSRDGTERIHVYHAVDGQGAGYGCDKARNVRLQPYHFDQSGELQLGEPVSRGYTLPTPSGESRFELERSIVDGHNDKALIEDKQFSAGAGVTWTSRSDSLHIDELRAPATGVYALTLAYRNEGKAIKQAINVNGIQYHFSLAQEQVYDTVTMLLELKGGVNELELSYSGKEVVLDYVELSYVDLAAAGEELVPGLALTREHKLEILAQEAQTKPEAHHITVPEGSYTIAVAYRNASSQDAVKLIVDGQEHQLKLKQDNQWRFSSLQLSLSQEVSLQLERVGAVELAFIRVLTAPPEAVELRFVNRLTGIALMPNNGSKKIGEGYRQYKVSDTPAQSWVLEAAEEGGYYFKNSISGLYMTSMEGSAQQQSFNGAEEQRWLLHYEDDGSYSIVNEATGLAPTAIHSDPNLYENLAFEEARGDISQIWYLRAFD